jgi:hypothetical protein
MKKSYSELLEDPRWQEKREEIIQRDNHKCMSCKNKDEDAKQLGNYLHVHHIVYKTGLKPWEYDNDDLITLCDDCHKFITKKINTNIEIIRRICVDDDIAEQIEFLLSALLQIKNPWLIRKIGKIASSISLQTNNYE